LDGKVCKAKVVKKLMQQNVLWKSLGHISYAHCNVIVGHPSIASKLINKSILWQIQSHTETKSHKGKKKKFIIIST